MDYFTAPDLLRALEEVKIAAILHDAALDDDMPDKFNDLLEKIELLEELIEEIKGL